MQHVTIKGLHVYPVKSCGAIDLSEATIHERGFAYDRNWMIVAPDGSKITQREVPQMAQIKPRIEGDSLILSHSTCQPLQIALDNQGGDLLNVEIWDHRCNALDEGPAAAAWLSSLLRREVRLVKFDPSHVRLVEEVWAGTSGAHTGFSDKLPFLITSEESLHVLNEYREAAGLPVTSMSRFRPNIVIDGAGPFGEESIAALGVPGSMGRLELARPCSRCIITNIDQESGEKEQQGNLQILARHRNFKNIQGKPGAMFGVQAFSTKAEGQCLRVGEKLTVLDSDQGTSGPSRLFKS
jgi:uncharacterized protein YcbX